MTLKKYYDILRPYQVYVYGGMRCGIPPLKKEDSPFKRRDNNSLFIKM